MTIDAILLSDRRHAVVVLSGHVEPGCGTSLTNSLRVASRCHTVVDVRQIGGMSPEVVKSLLWALGQALDHRRTMRLVVRDEHQRAFLRGIGLGTMMPVHDSIAEAMAGVEAAIAEAMAVVRPAPVR